MNGKGIGFIDLISVVTRYHVVLVGLAMPDVRDEIFPDSGRTSRIKWMLLVVPAVESTNHRNLLGVGCPHREIRALGSIYFPDMRAQTLVQLDMRAFVKQVEIVIAEQRHLRVPRRSRPSFGFAPYLAACGAASSAALY